MKTAVFIHTYLGFVNRPEEFAQQRKIKDRALIRYLLARNEAMKIAIRERADIARRARQILSDWQVQTRAESLKDLAFTLRVSGRDELLADQPRLHAFIRHVAEGGTSGAVRRTLYDALMIQELLMLLGRDPVTEFARFRPLVQAWAQSRTGPASRSLAEYFPSHDVNRLRRLVHRAEKAVYRKWEPKLDGLERRAMPVIASIVPLEQLRRLHDRWHVCRHCSDVFFRPSAKRAQQYCPSCRRRWSKEQLWYRSGGKEKLQQWRAEARRRQKDEATRTR